MLNRNFSKKIIWSVGVVGLTMFLASCSQSMMADNNTNLSNTIVIEPSALIPVLDGKATSTGIYVRNTSDKEVSGIVYGVANTSNNVAIGISTNECTKIAAHSSCLLSLSTPELKLGDSGSSLIVAEYDNKQSKQLVNYSYVDSKSYSGVNFSDGSQTLYGAGNYATVYVFVGKSQAANNVGFNVSDNSIAVSSGLTNGKVDLQTNEVHALEIQTNQNITTKLATITPYTVTSSKDLQSNLNLGVQANDVLQVIITPTQQANLLMSTLPILTQTESTVTLMIVNNGNQTATNLSLISSSNDITVTAASTNACTSSLIAGGSCNYNISLANNYSNGSAILSLNYNNSQSLTSVEQTAYYLNNMAEPMVELVPTQSQYTAQIGSAANYVTFNITNLGNAPLNNVVTNLRNNLQNTAFSLQNNTCPISLPSRWQCSIELLITPSNNVANGVAYLNMTGSFTGATAKNYSFMSLPVSISIIDTTAPEVVSTTPANTSIGVSTSTGVTVNFSEPMNPTTLNSSNIWLASESVQVLLSFQGVTNNNQTVDFTLANGVKLDGLTTYNIVVNASQIRDENGNAIGDATKQVVSSFITKNDSTPTITGFMPNNGSNNVSQTPSMTITFSEAINPLGMTASNIMLKDSSGTLVSDYSVVYDESNFTATILLNNGVSLTQNTTYEIYVNQTNITSIGSGNALGSNANYLVSSFTTGDYVAPELIVSSTIPLNGATEVSTITPISLTFSEAMNTNSLSNSTVKLLRNKTEQSILLDDGAFSNGDKTVTFYPTESLIGGESYSIVINPSEITDASTNHNAMGVATSQVVSDFITFIPTSNFKIVGDSGMINTYDSINNLYTNNVPPKPTSTGIACRKTDGLCIAVGASGGILRSIDSINWTFINSKITVTLMSVAVNNDGLFVAVGISGVIFTSSDGITWTKRESGVSSSIALYNVSVVSNNLFVALGSSGTLLTSLDGITWTLKPQVGSGNTIRGIAENESGLFVVVGNFGDIYTSLDMITWTRRTSKAPSHLNAVTINSSGLFVAVGSVSSSDGIIVTSPDGINWTRRTSGVNAVLNGVTVNNNGIFTVVGNNGTIVTSSDGLTWRSQVSGVLSTLNGIALNSSGLLIAVGDVGTVLTSSDAIEWMPRNSGVSATLNGVTINNDGLFVAVGNSGTTGVILTSSNGESWVERVSGLGSNTYLYGVAVNSSGLFVAIGHNGTIITSTDGITWTSRSSGTSSVLRGITINSNGLFVAVGDGGTILTSHDGESWVVRPSGITTNLYGVTVNKNGLFVAVGFNGVITSPDGVTWAFTSGVTGFIRGITVSKNGSFIAVGINGTILTSSNGESWTSSSSGVPDTAYLNAISVNSSGELIAVGGVGVVFTSSDNGVSWNALNVINGLGLNAVVPY